MNEKVRMRDGDAILVMVQDGKVLHHSWNMGLPHVEFVRRATGELPEGAWVGTVSKLDGEVMVCHRSISSTTSSPRRPR
jgi:hypothetical protein